MEAEALMLEYYRTLNHFRNASRAFMCYYHHTESDVETVAMLAHGFFEDLVAIHGGDSYEPTFEDIDLCVRVAIRVFFDSKETFISRLQADMAKNG